MGTEGVEFLAALAAVQRAGSILEGIRCADDLAGAARHGGAAAVKQLADAAADSDDQLTAIAAVHALAPLVDTASGDTLVSLLASDAPFLSEHAAWVLGARRSRFDAIPALVEMVAGGGFRGMIAQRTLERWGGSSAEPVAAALVGALPWFTDPGARARLVETAGLVPGRIPERLLRRVAIDTAEPAEARAAAVAALGDRGPSADAIRIIGSLGRGNDALADVARLALSDLIEPTEPAILGSPGGHARTVAQLFLPADIDHELSQVGSGDNGGIATLLVRLGDALVGERPAGIEPGGQAFAERVLTLSRGRPADALRGLAELAATTSGHVFAAVPFLGDHVPSVDAWPGRVAAERGIRRILRRAGAVDAIHLRMADVGTLAASAVARDLDIPVVFTLAPDPHGGIAALESAGELTRANFGARDEQEHFWFRARLVHRMRAEAAHVVLFPRPELRRDLLALLGFDIARQPQRHTVVAEGIDLAVIERARSEALAALAPGEAADSGFDSLDELLGALPETRRGLPLAVTVGRIHAVKGTAALAVAWAADSGLRERCNLLIVGGDLERPSAEERRQLDQIDSVVPRPEGPTAGLLLAGHRANGTVALWLAAARYGRPGLAAPHGVYVCASTKEEFGLAVLEAMASGLMVVAPFGGGPATFVEHGVTGFLVDTRDPVALAGGITDALDLAAGTLGSANADRAHDMVAGRFAIQTMADALSRVYRDVADASAPAARQEDAS